MIIKPYSFNGTSLQSTDYETSYPRSSALAQAQSNLSYVARASAPPVFSGKDFQPVTMNLEIKCLHNYTTLQEQLNTLFDIWDETPRQFIIQDTEDTSAENPKQYYVYATTKQVLGGHDGEMVTVTLGFDDPVWRSVTENSQAWAVTASGQSTDFVNNGNADAFPTYEIEVTGYAATGYVYNNYISYKPVSAYAWTNRPLEILGDTDNIGMDTAALVAAGKCLASGNDFRVMVDGVEVDRWFGGAGFNSTDTKCWININQPVARTLTLKAAMDSTSTPTEVEFAYTAANLTSLNAMPGVSRFVIDNEEFSYTAKVVVAKKTLKVTGVTRATRNTSAATHSLGATVTWIPYDINIMYGSSDAAAPDIDDTRKPVFDLTTPNNSSFVYDKFSDIAQLRSGSWKGSIVKRSSVLLSESDLYTGVNNGGDTDPSDVMGMYIVPYQALGTYKPETSNLQWIGYFPDGVSSVAFSYERYQGTATWPTVAGLYASALGTAYTVSKNLPSTDMPTTDLGTWVTGSYATTDLNIVASARYLKFNLSGSVKAATAEAAYLGITAATVNLTNPPVVTRRGEQNNYYFDVTITNSTTSKSMTVKYPLRTGKTMYIVTDPDFPNAKFDSQIVNGAITTDTIRADWLALQAGSNTLTITADYVGTFTITAKWRDRMNLL